MSKILNIPIDSGDIVLFARPCMGMDPLSAFICLGAKSIGATEYDHIGLVVSNPDTGELFLLEANAKGITLYPLIDRLKRTKAEKVAVRKLLREPEPNYAIHIHKNESENMKAERVKKFQQDLYALAQEYVKKSYNHSLVQMTTATVLSYTSANTEYVRALSMAHHLEDDLHLVEQLLLPVEKSGQKLERHTKKISRGSHPSQYHGVELTNHMIQQSPFLQEALKHRKLSIEKKLSRLQNIIQQIDNSESSPTQSSNHELKPYSESYYCSQLVAEIFTKLDILHSNHRHAHQYIPADFSSATVVKALYGQKGQFTNRNAHDHFAFSGDFVFDPKQVSLEGLMNGGNKISLSFREKDGEKQKGNQKVAEDYTVTLHVNDSIPSSILKQLVCGEVSLHGSIRIMADGNVVGVVRSAHHHSPSFTSGNRVSNTNSRVPLTQYLSYLGELYGLDHLTIHAYNDTTTLHFSPCMEQPLKASSVPLSQNRSLDIEHFDMMMIEECLRQAWFGFQSRNVLAVPSLLKVMESTTGAGDSVEIMDAIIKNLQSEHDKQFQNSWLKLKMVLGDDILHMLQHHVFPHHRYETADHKDNQQQFQLNTEQRQMMYALKHLFYLSALLDAALRKESPYQSENLSIFSYMVKHYVLEDNNAWYFLDPRGKRDNEKKEKAIQEAFDRLSLVSNLSSEKSTKNRDISVVKSAMLLGFSAMPLINIFSSYGKYRTSTWDPSSNNSTSQPYNPMTNTYKRIIKPMYLNSQLQLTQKFNRSWSIVLKSALKLI